MIIRSTRPVTSVVQNTRNVEAIAEGDSVALSEQSDTDSEAQAVLDNYSELDENRKAIVRSVIEKADYKFDDNSGGEFVTAAMAGLGGAGLAALSGRTDVFSLIGGAAVGIAAGYGGHKVGAAIWEKVEKTDGKIVLESKAGQMPSITASWSFSS
ncbi:hypothetical protein [Marinovum sp.]|uniref:hypothetical protein n=1 Tax=Marinovum sp. TaxID=2024839 RepID=UPI002B265891|nr:hypothetical protein [Marinovum sp.]